MAEPDRPVTTDTFNAERCSDLYEDLVAVFQKHKPTVGEILIAYGNLGYTLGASIGHYDEKGPGLEELKKLYYSEPGRLDVALMLQGLTVTAWYEDWQEVRQVKEQGETK